MAQIKWRREAFREIRRLPAVKADLARRAEAIAAACGGEDAGYVAATGEGRTRSRAAVIAAHRGAQVDNAVNNRIVRSLDAGR